MLKQVIKVFNKTHHDCNYGLEVVCHTKNSIVLHSYFFFNDSKESETITLPLNQVNNLIIALQAIKHIHKIEG